MIFSLKKVIVVFCYVFIIGFTINGQTNIQGFEKFANTNDSLFIGAYQHKDTSTYVKLLDNFLVEFDKLSESKQKQFIGYKINAFYNLSCTYSLLKDKNNGVYYFKKSIELGYSNYSQIQKDSDLDFIRNEAEFKETCKKLREQFDYLFILKKAVKYDTTDYRVFPSFSYQNSSTSGLQLLSQTYNLDSVAGNNSELSRIKNILFWIHNLVPHDGTHSNPKVKNAVNFISECKKDKKGLNCRGLALLLNECYLAVGIPSRVVTCLPKDSLKNDVDCHVINAVYSKELNKWLWIDPTMNAFITDQFGVMLGIEEVRQRLIADEPLSLNSEANWNGASVDIKQYLYEYMAKNLYILECPIYSKYDMETKRLFDKYKYVKLIPLDYNEQKPDLYKRKSRKFTTLFQYKTNNSKLFWVLPSK